MNAELNAVKGRILIVDDEMINRILLSTNLQESGYRVEMAEDGRQALELLRLQPFDLLLLDIVMPVMDGYQVLEQMKADEVLRHLPVVVISALDQIDSIVRCIESGAEDYLTKPFDRVLLQARIEASLEKKRWRDQEQEYLRRIEVEQEKVERLLLNILPAPIAERLKQGETIIADSFDLVSVLFADIVNFTPRAAQLPPNELVGSLNDIFSRFDRLAERHGLEKIKTLGDGYMVVGGLPTPRVDHAQAIADFALDIQAEIARCKGLANQPCQLRIGIHMGPVVAGVIGEHKFSYDLWGDTVNVAARMQSLGLAGRIQVTQAFYQHLQGEYRFEERGKVPVPGKGEMLTYLLDGKK
ncbi:MAG: response regulator [Anaerolineales bacterium]|nr:response regulator [Anaerolineales bacterium]